MVRIDRSTLIYGWPGRLLALSAVAVVLVVWLLHTPAGLLGKADAVAYAVCHRIDARSFHLGDRQLPLCARCTGMFLGGLLGLLFQAYTRPKHGDYPAKRTWAVLVVFFLAFAIDGTNSYFHLFPGFKGLYEPNNGLRLLTGTGMGLVLAAVLFPAFNQTVWKDYRRAPAIGGFGSLGILVLLGLALDGLVWTQNPLVLYPLALLSALGVLVILTLVYTMVSVMVLRVENQALSTVQLALPVILGVGITFVQIGGLDFVRYLLTGTWDGFKFG